MYQQLEDEPQQRRRARALSNPGIAVAREPAPRVRARSFQGAQFDYANLPPLRNPAPQQAPPQLDAPHGPPLLRQDQLPPQLDVPLAQPQQQDVPLAQPPRLDVPHGPPLLRQDQLLRPARRNIQDDDIEDVPVVNERTRLLPRARANSLDGHAPVLPPGHSQNRYGSTLGTNVADFVTANTPGQLTGVAGAGGTATNIMGGNGSLVAKNLSLNTGAMNASGLGFTAATGLSDVVGMGRNVAQIYRGGKAWHAAPTGSLAADEGKSAVKRGALDLATTGVDLGAQTSSGVQTGLGIAGKAAPAALGVGGAIAGLAVNSAVFLRNAWRGGRAWMHQRSVGKARTHEDVEAASPAVQDAAKHHEDQLKARKWRAGAGMLGAGLGIAGGAAMLALGLSNPIGWGLLAAGGAVAAGLGLYKLGRWAWKKHKGTLGEDRHAHATSLVNAVKNNPEDHADHVGAKKVLEARGIDVAKLRAASQQDALDHVKRKAEAW